MKIVHVADYTMPSMGYQEFLLAKWNARHGHDVHIVTSDRYTPVPDYNLVWKPLLGTRIVGAGTERIEGVTIHRLPCALELRRRIWLSGFGQKIADISPDVVLCHGTTSPLAFALPRICHRLGIALLMDNHMTFVAQRKGLSGWVYYLALRALTRRILNGKVHLFVGIDRECREFMVREQGIPSEKVQILEVGVDTELFYPDDSARQRARADHAIPPDAKVVLQTGKLTRDKSPHWLSQAMGPLMKRDPRVWLVFTGDAGRDYMPEIVGPLLQRDVADRLRFTPFVKVERLMELYNLADVCVYPNASSLSCLEAASCARPVVVTDLPWGKERERAGLTLCYETGNVGDLGQKIDRLLSDESSRAAIGRRARNSVLEKYSYDVIASGSEGLMRKAIETHGQN